MEVIYIYRSFAIISHREGHRCDGGLRHGEQEFGERKTDSCVCNMMISGATTWVGLINNRLLLFGEFCGNSVSMASSLSHENEQISGELTAIDKGYTNFEKKIHQGGYCIVKPKG